MAIVVLGSNIPREKAVRTLVYEEDNELNGATLETLNAGTVECEVGTSAIKMGFAASKMLGSDGEWHDATEGE